MASENVGDRTDGTFSAILLFAFSFCCIAVSAYRVCVFMTVPSQAMNSDVASAVLTRVDTRGTEQGAVISLGTLNQYRKFLL